MNIDTEEVDSGNIVSVSLLTISQIFLAITLRCLNVYF